MVTSFGQSCKSEPRIEKWIVENSHLLDRELRWRLRQDANVVDPHAPLASA